MNKSIVILILYFTILSFLTAQNIEAPRGVNQERRVYPMQNHISAVDIEFGSMGEKYEIHIHPCDPIAEKMFNKKIFYVKPVFAFIPRKNPLFIGKNKLPQIIHKVTFIQDKALVEFYLKNYDSKAFEAECYKAIKEAGITEDFEVRKWPLTEIVGIIYLNNRYVAHGVSGNLVGQNEIVKLVIEFKQSLLSDFLNSFNDSIFEFRYKFINERSEYASAEVNASAELQTAIALNLSSKQKKGKKPILQTDYRAFESKLNRDLMVRIFATTRDAIPEISGLVKNLSLQCFEFDSLRIDEYLQKYQLAEQQIIRYLQPIIQQVVDSRADVKQKNNVKMKHKKVGGGISAIFGIFGIGADLSRSEIRRIEDLSGISITKTDKKFEIEAHEIKIYSLKEGSEKEIGKVSQVNCFNIGPSQNYWRSPYIPTSFTDKVFDNFKAKKFERDNRLEELEDSLKKLGNRLNREVEKNNLPYGSIVIWHKKIIPNGWVICDGKNGTPDLRGRFIVGAGKNFVFGSKGGEMEHSHSITIPAKGWGEWDHHRVSGWLSGSGRSKDEDHTVKGDRLLNTISNSHLPPFRCLNFIMKIK